jgi:hypothetical protein
MTAIQEISERFFVPKEARFVPPFFAWRKPAGFALNGSSNQTKAAHAFMS